MNAQLKSRNRALAVATATYDSGNSLSPAAGANGTGRAALDGSPHRPRAVGRRGARHCARGRAQGSRRIARADLVRDRNQHGRDRRGDVRGGPDACGDGEARPRGQLGGDLPGQAPARGNRGPPQDRRLQDAVRARVRPQGWRAGAAQGRARRDRDRVGIPLDGDAGLRRHRLSEASDTVSRDSHRHRDGPGSRARQRQPGAGDAREHVGARGDVAGRDRRAAARRRRPSPTICRSTRRASSAAT